MKREIQSKKEAWLHAVRLRTLPLALASILAGSFLAKWQDAFRWEVFALASLTTVFLQILSNLANDYGDSIHGADSSARKGPIRAVQSGLISLPEMKRAMYLFGGLSLVTGLLLLCLVLPNWPFFLGFLALGLFAIWAAIRYTSGSNPYGYAGLGDISVFIFFGLVGVFGTYFLNSLQAEPMVFLIAIGLGCFSTAVLNINNIRDIDSDRLAGKRSIPVRIGRTKALTYHWTLITVAYLALFGFAWLDASYSSLLACLTFPWMYSIGKGIQKASTATDTDPYLKQMALSTLVWTLLFGIGLIS
ncbi:MAG: 1,4-dihydroxy-2-naphthoate polyprenyltransferase [Algoriphagus sp.]|nr:1,4-dihydroxy-2-naphthoate polyprenyltransferase [Algoriphagus sp.]